MEPRRRPEESACVIIADTYLAGSLDSRGSLDPPGRQLVKTMGIEGVSKSQGFQARRSEFDKIVESFRSRPPDARPVYLRVDHR